MLWAEDDQTVGRIGEKLFLESSTLTPLLKRLEQGGYLRRARDGADERLVRVRLTEAGSALRHRSDCTSKLLGKLLQGDEVRELRDRVVSLRERVRATEYADG